jgi:hypothetical protein
LKTTIKIFKLFVLLILSELGVFAQGKITVITKSIENQFTMYKKPMLFLNTERGVISIKGWYHADIKVVLKLTAKNADASLAQKELEFMKYSIAKNSNSVNLSNQMILMQPNKAISSVIIAEYEIYVPYETNLRVYNQFGKVEIENVKGNLVGELHYSDLNINNKSGVINMIITIGDINCSKSNFTGTILARHSNISIKETEGKFHLETEYGKIGVIYGEEILNLSLKCNATEINIENKSCKPMELYLDGSYCPLKISEICFTPEKNYLKSDYKPNSDQEFWELEYTYPNIDNKLIINSKFGSLNLY